MRFIEMLKGGMFPLVMSLPANDPDLAEAAWEAGADVVKVHINVHHHASGHWFKTFDEERPVLEEMLRTARGPMGIVLGGDPESALRDFAKAEEAGFDFLSLYGQNAAGRILRHTGMSRMIAPDCTWSEGEIAGLQRAGADILEASVMDPDSYGQPFNARDAAKYARIASLTDLPIVVPTQHQILPEDVEVLRRAGVSCVMIGAVVTGREKKTIYETVKAFRQAIDRMKEEG